MSGSHSKYRWTAAGNESTNWRNSNRGKNTEQNADAAEVGFQRRFQRKSSFGEQSSQQHGIYQSRGRSSNNRASSRGRYNAQPTNSFSQSSKRQHVPYVSRNTRGDSRHDHYSIQYFDSTRLEQLSKMNSDNLITTLTKQKTEFEQFLNGTFTSDSLVMTLSVLANLCRGNFTASLTSILSRACSETFLKSLETYMMKLCFETESETKNHNKLYWNNRNGFWHNLIEIFQNMIYLLPSKARDELTGILGKTNRIITNIENNQDYMIDGEVKVAVLNMFDFLQEQLKKFETRAAIREIKFEELDDDPPEDFRTLSVIPTIEDMFNNNPFIRANKVKEAYNSVEHYLDVQFRLLREDFISPLRDGLREYLNESGQRRNKNLRIYRRVTFVFQTTAELHSGCTIFFGIKNWNWKDSRRLMFGGLLCLSKDNFNTILFATVANRNEKDLCEGILVIKPCDGTEITRDFYEHEFVMLESKLYFEPYYVVLNAMRDMNKHNFPMKHYLVDADTSTFRPRYLNVEEIELCYKNYLLPVAADKEWPSAEDLELDEMQYRAFKCAVTQDFAVIQGPPGTGKTFLALQIIRTMLSNAEHWSKYGPIVVVCLTNHALDQFLNGVLDYTDSIVRVGARSKNPELERCTLKNRRQSFQPTRENFDDDDDDNWAQTRAAQQNMYYAKRELDCKSRELADTFSLIQDLTKKNAIIPLRRLKEYCDDSMLHDLVTDHTLLEWLIGIKFPNSSMYLDDVVGEIWQHQLIRHMTIREQLFADVLLPLTCIDDLIARINERIDLCRNDTEGLHELPFDPTNEWEYDIYELGVLRSILQQNLAQHPLVNMNNQGHHQNLQWQTYWQWITVSYDNAVRALAKLQRECDELAEELNVAKQIVDLEVLRGHKVIGLTTTAAARLHGSLRALGAPIVLVEEAAEILEAHVVCSLTKSCQHIILIGDHKQLRPKAAVHELGTKYNLNISLFERMVNIRGNYTQLANQHRMRPEIAKLISPSIYETLYNHESVCEYPDVKGLVKNLFFLHHTHEEVSFDQNEDTWTNPHEAKFLVAFARHLVLQGYAVSEITILCTYAGQLFTLMQEKNYYPILRDLRVTTIDNYQGEENKIILLSLVRNNEEGNVGFLKEENRVCVALSRAREGLYVMGNMDNLTTKNHIWPKIKQVLEDDNAIGNSLELRCQIHCEEITRVQNTIDFQNCPEGGCLKKCDAKLPCGHSCLSVCHISDQKHEEYKCTQPCVETCPRSHPCPLTCSQTCQPCLIFDDRELKCGHTVSVPCWADSDTFPCPVKVNAVLPDCNHTVVKPCHKTIIDYPCSHPCDIRVPCGHSCVLNCHVNNDPDHLKYKCKKDCTKNNLNCTMDHACNKQCGEECTLCEFIRKKERSCGHYFDCECSQDVEEIICVKPCKRLMDCGHICQLTCDVICGNCKKEVEKISSCGHTIKVKCHEEATPSKCSGNCERKLPCGHLCTAKCKDPCIKVCKRMTTQTKPGLCGHVFSVPCYMQDSEDPQKLLRYCKEPCKAELACGHMCKGNCGSCKQGRIHIPCRENCGNILICGHGCGVPCRQECPPCKKACQVKCRHNRCNKKCGEPCTPCKEKCNWACPHLKCTKRCFELCDREPCNKPCWKYLKCGHPCVGFCGDPCPNLCRICHAEELTEVFLGHEDEPEARFVLLEDCGHCIESQGLLEWLKTCGKSVQMKTCPRCKTFITKCMRIMNQIKTDVKDVQRIKRKIFGDQTQLQNQQQLLFKEIQVIANNPVLKIFSDLKIFLDTLRPTVLPVTKKKKRQVLDARAIEATKITLNILQQMVEKLKDIDHTVKIYPWLKDQIVMLVQSLSVRGQITNQEINDIEPELQRLHYMAEICKMNLETVFENSDSMEHEISFIAVIEKLTSIEKFTESRELEIKKEVTRLAPLLELKKAIIIDAERKMIVKAMGFKQGHWFKCPNGHIYSIGECGGAMVESKCYECEASIGGGSHRLRSDNSLATEMDGASRPAWPGSM